MKNKLNLIIILCFCISCTESEIEKANKVLTEIEKPMNSTQVGILNNLKPTLLDIAKRKATFSRSGGEALYQSEQEFDKLEFTSLPYYELNENDFYNDPSPENLINCIKPTEDRCFFIGKKDGNIAVAIEAIKENSEWKKGRYFEGIDYFKQNFSWLSVRLKNCDSGSVCFLSFLGHIYVMCTIEKEPYFFNFIGTQCMDKKTFAQKMLDRKNIKDETQEYFKKLSENPDLIKDSRIKTNTRKIATK